MSFLCVIFETFKFAADTRKMLPRYSELCGAAFDAVGVVKLGIKKDL